MEQGNNKRMGVVMELLYMFFRDGSTHSKSKIHHHEALLLCIVLVIDFGLP